MNEDLILLAHGGGGSLSKKLIGEVIIPEFHNQILEKLDDGACLTVPELEIVFTTDSYVVDPLFFPGGDIGKLAACGTINDLAMEGAQPKYMSLGLILEEGLLISDLRKVLCSMSKVLKETGVKIVTGDTKVVERGRGSGIYINTSGLGVRKQGVNAAVSNAKLGDAVILTGSIGEHGMAVMGQREGLNFKSSIESDVAPLCDLIRILLETVPEVHCLRDPTRGGVSAALNDIASSSGTGIEIQQKRVPLKDNVIGACNLLGLDPMQVANEGKAIVVCAESSSESAINCLRNNELGKDACIIGRVVSGHAGTVLVETGIGGIRILDIPSGESLPRIC
ncbi:MAG: hydrogenase expression/formation protein HypE [Candidatus Theseobacter exili]|nr:hydrogenase expression/formation protein HypE [Candidatus Theseobacter exili]